jgi:cell division protein FtsQ
VKVKAPTEKNFRRSKTVKPVKKKSGSRWVSPRAAAVCAATAFGLFATYKTFDLVLHASALQVQNIHVKGKVRLSRGDIEAVLDDLRGSNILRADLEKSRTRLRDLPWVADVALRRVLPSTIEVFVSERQPIGLCRLRDELYLIDRSGTIIDEFGPRYAQFDLPIIDGVHARSAGETVVDPQRAALAARVIDSVAGHKSLAARVSQIDVKDVHDAVVLLDGDPALLHVGEARFAERLQDYLDLAETLRQTVPDIEYADLRFDDRIYVRPTGSAGMQAAQRRPARD